MFRNVFLCYVTIIVDKDFEHHHCVLRNFIESIQNDLFVMETWIAWVKQLEEYGFDEDKNYAFKMLPEVQEKAEKDRCHKWEDSFFIAHTVSQKTFAKSVFDFINECFLGQEWLFWLFKDGKDKFKANDFGSHGKWVYLLVLGLVAISTYWKFNDTSKNKNCICISKISFI